MAGKVNKNTYYRYPYITKTQIGLWIRAFFDTGQLVF